MKYSIIIGVYGHFLDLTKPCIESIIKYTDLLTCEIIIVANGCKENDGTRAYVEKLGPPFRLLWFDEPLGYAKANNAGVAIAKYEKIVLLNNDTVLLDQQKNRWLDQLEEPFLKDPMVGISGPLLGHSEPANHDFLVFFCVMTTKELFDKLKLNEDYGVGAGEDTEYCIELEKLGYKVARCAEITGSDNTNKLVIGDFPIFHAGEGTLKELPNWKSSFDENSLKLAKKYNKGWYNFKLSNDFERAVLGKEDNLPENTREHARYTFAANNLVGKKVLEFGCSSGYALKFLPKDIDYTGVDYDETIIKFAKENFDGPRTHFIHCDAHSFDFSSHYDTIIAFEFIEHIDDGKEFAQKLKQHCDNLLITTPFRETPGFWGKHHKLHNLSEKDFPDFDYKYVGEYGGILDKPTRFDGQQLMIMRWEKGKEYPKIEPSTRVLCSIATKDRYDILSSCLVSVALQTRVPDEVIIYDDGEQKDLREDPIYRHIFRLFDRKGIKWSFAWTPKKGQHYGHDSSNKSDFDYVWRLDDDEVAEPDVLEKLLAHMTKDVGAVAGAVFEPGNPQYGGSNKLVDIFHKPNLQWAPGNEVVEVEHLYSSFLYRPRIAQYTLELSPVAHREETMFSHELFKKGYKLIVDTSIKTYHFRQATGGIRSHNSEFFYENDERIFAKKLEDWGYKVISLDTGLGDHLVFLNILPDLIKKYKHIILGCCYPNVFQGHDVTIVPMAATKKSAPEHIYKWCIDNNWKTSILNAYKAMYGV